MHSFDGDTPVLLGVSPSEPSISREDPKERPVDVHPSVPHRDHPDLSRALGFYRDLLDGKVSYEFPGPDGEPGYIGMEIGTSHIGIGRDPTAAPPQGGRPISLWVYADDCDAAVERLRGADVEITEEPTDQPWGERVARVRDPDGNEVVIGSRPE